MYYNELLLIRQCQVVEVLKNSLITFRTLHVWCIVYKVQSAPVIITLLSPNKVVIITKV